MVLIEITIMKKFNLLLFFATLFAVNTGFSQTESYTFYDFGDSTQGCTEGLYVYMAVGANPETGGILTVDWGDGSTETVNYTTTMGQGGYGVDLTHGYTLAGTYTVNINVYSGTAGANVDAGQSLTMTATDPANCGFVYIYTSQSAPSVSYTDVAYDFTGADGITTTIIPGMANPNWVNTYSGLNLANAPYTVSINDTWLANNGLNQVTPDFIITGFDAGGMAFNGQVAMEVECAVAAANPDFAVSYAYAWNLVAPLQTGSLNVNVCNYACANTDDAHVTIEFPAGFVPNTTGLTNAVFAGTTLTYDILALNDCDWHQISFTFPGTVAAGTQVPFMITVSHPDDSDLSNNTQTVTGYVLNSYDPNSKDVNQPTHINPNVQEELQYVIHFQNDGNFDAMDVVVTDVIDMNLDFSSFQLVGAKHGVATSVDPATRTVTFSFNDINLAQSSVDLDASQGYVIYKIKENAGLPVNSTIENTANIYFDFNPAIVTNTTYNVNQALSVGEQAMEMISMFPNPATSTVRFNGATVNTAMVYDAAGKLLINATSLNNNELSVAMLANGIYQVVIVTANGAQTQKLVIRN
jgi:fimbrial isopeptide formation D2 family protein